MQAARGGKKLGVWGFEARALKRVHLQRGVEQAADCRGKHEGYGGGNADGCNGDAAGARGGGCDGVEEGCRGRARHLMYAFSGRAVFNSVASVTRFSLLSGAAAPSFSFLDFEAIFPVNGEE